VARVRAQSTAPVRISVQRETKPGERVVVLGNVDALGNWDMGKAFRLKWTDGHVWCQTCEVPIDEEVEFKIVELKEDDGTMTWEGGENRSFKALGADHSLEVMCEWDETGSTLIEAKKIGEGGEELMKRVEGPARIPTLKIKEDKKKEVGQEKEEGQEKDDGKKDTKNKKDKEKKEKDQTEERKGEERLLTVPVTEIQAFLSSFKPNRPSPNDLLVPTDKNRPHIHDPCHWMCEEIKNREPECERSLMHRFDQGNDMVGKALEKDTGAALVAITAWLRFSAQRLLCWNKNYNVKPREISAAQDRLCGRLVDLYTKSGHDGSGPELRPLLRLTLSSVGRGGKGDVGQRIRDDILGVQSRNGAKGGMMEEWHQKLHNNTSPDDVVICEALLAYLDSGLNIKAYWEHLESNGITKERLLSYDRAIHNEPKFNEGQVPGLKKDLTDYLQTLRAVHCGTDLASAAGNVLGYDEPDMKRKKSTSVAPVPNVATKELRLLLASALYLQQRVQEEARVGKADGTPKDLESTRALLQILLHARHNIRPFIVEGGHACDGRLPDVVFLDLALEGATRTALEASLSLLRGVASSIQEGPSKAAELGALLSVMAMALEGVTLSSYPNDDLVSCLKSLNTLEGMNDPSAQKDRGMQCLAVVEKLKRALSQQALELTAMLQPTASHLGGIMNLPGGPVGGFSEEVVRGTPAAPLSQVVGVTEPSLRRMLGAGDWLLVSRGSEDTAGSVQGVVRLQASLQDVQFKTYNEPTILVVDNIAGTEEVPEGCVAVLSANGQCPDVLSHSAVRARNMSVLLAACYSPEVSAGVKQMEGQNVTIALEDEAAGTSLRFSSGAGGPQEQAPAPAAASADAPAKKKSPRDLKISVPQWPGKWVVGMDEYAPGVVGAKSRNIQGLQGKLPDWISLPPSVTLPFGCFEQALEAEENADVKKEISARVAQIQGGAEGSEAGRLLAELRSLAMQVSVPKVAREQLMQAMKTAGIPLPDSVDRWAKAVEAIKGVWASKYNDRAYFSLRKIGLSFEDVRMAVLVQRVVPAHYAFVIHTRNPSNNDPNEIFCELVRGLGESLVSGEVSGSAFAFKANKSDLDEPEVLHYASKSEGMFVGESLIFRSDSNGEDLEGYAGAGLYESITMDATKTLPVDYLEDKLVTDVDYRQQLLARICKVGAAIEDTLGSAQDVEGVVEEDGSITVVQTRPQV